MSPEARTIRPPVQRDYTKCERCGGLGWVSYLCTGLCETDWDHVHEEPCEECLK